MLPGLTLPGSLMALLGALRPCFSAPSFRTFCGLAAGLAGQPRRRTVVGMLLGAGLSRAWPHDRAHYFFARARWEIDELGLAVARLAVPLLVPAGAPLTVAVDDSLFRRAGRKVYGAGWQYDGSSPSQNRLSFGTCFVVAGIVVHLPFLTRPVCLPVLGRLVPAGQKPRPRTSVRAQRKTSAPGSKTAAAVALVTLLAAAFPGRPVHVVADALYHGPALRQLPATVTWTTRLPANAVLYALAPALPPGRHGPGRPPVKGRRLGTPAQLAAAAGWGRGTVHAYGASRNTALATVTCLWHGCLGTRTVRVILAKDGRHPLLALVTTDLHATAAALVTRYAARWSIEQAFSDARNVLGAGEARSRTRRAVQRTVPFALLIHTLVIIWYARHGHRPQIIAARRASQPWYTTKAGPAFEDMLTQLRRTLITARISAGSQANPTPRQTQEVLAAWHAAAA
jgi:DDE superfamily endonuclease